MNEMLPNEEPPNLADYDEPIVTKKTTLENFPNPFMNPIECNRINVEESYICDPDKILKTSEADRIDELLSLERLSSTHHCEGYGEVPYKIGVAIINSIAKEDVNTLADELLERWKLSHERCDDGILLLFTKQEPDVLIKYDKGVEPYLSAKVISTIYPMCQALLQDEKLAIAIEKCTSFVTKRVTGEILPPKETPQMLVTLVIASIIGIGYLSIVISSIADMHQDVTTIGFYINSIIEKSNVYRDDRITITNNQNEFKINETQLLESAKTYRAKLKLEDFMLDIYIEDESNMRLINHEQLGEDKPTDIISIRDELRYIKSKYHLNRTPYKSKEQYHLGEIFLCPKYIEKMSEMELNDERIQTKDVLKMSKSGGVARRIQGVKDINTRMCLLLAHGILHLVGYDHIRVEDYREMASEEDSLLDTLIEDIIENNG
nr:hypothetical protein MACL_00000849 [Theileria orientalis]